MLENEGAHVLFGIALAPSIPFRSKQCYAHTVALYTPLTVADLGPLTQAYQVSIRQVTGLVAGSVNSNFVLELMDGSQLFLRLYEEQDAHGALAEAKLLHWLVAKGVPAVAPVRRQDGSSEIISIKGKATALFPWNTGSIRCLQTVTESDLEQVGHALAQIHVAGSPQPRASRFAIEQLIQRCKHIEDHASPELAPWGPKLSKLLVNLQDQLRHFPPQGLCHGDLFRDNVLWNGNSLACLLDFESAAQGCFAFDMAVTMWAWCYTDQLEIPRFQALLRGYRQVRSWDKQDLESFYMQAQLAALRFTVTRITDYAMRSGQSANEQRDFQRFWARYQALIAQGERGIQTLLTDLPSPSL
jgi:homoserine kinase type II